VLNVLHRAEKLSLSRRVAESAELFARLLREGLASCKAVRDVRIFGLLLGIELNADRWPHCWFRKRLFSFYLVNLLHHARYPVLAGFCQYEPNVLKITPPLTVQADQVRQVCATLTDVLNRPFPRLLPALLGSVRQWFPVWRKKHDHHNAQAVDALAR
jgi:4-aminobutyrate aminotransferase-like enzyme